MPCQKSEFFSSHHERLQALLHRLGMHPLPRFILAPLGLVVLTHDIMIDSCIFGTVSFIFGVFFSLVFFSFSLVHRVVGLSNFHLWAKKT